MADVLKVLGQSQPPAGILTDIYTAIAQGSVSTISICNTSPYDALFRLSIAIGGAADDFKQYIHYDAKLKGNKTLTVTIGISFAIGTVIRGYSDIGTVSFNIFGVEI